MPKECTVKNKKGCFYDYTHQALCYKDPFFGNPNSGIGEPSSNSSYRFFGMPNDSCVSQNQKKNYDLFGEAYGPRERCFVGSLQREGKFKQKTVKFQSNGSFCFTSRCVQKPETPNEEYIVEIEIKGQKFNCTYGG